MLLGGPIGVQPGRRAFGRRGGPSFGGMPIASARSEFIKPRERQPAKA